MEATFANTLGVEEVYLPADTGLLDGGALQARLAQSWDQVGAASAALAAQLPGTWETPPEEGPLLTVRTVEEVTYTQPVDPPVEEVPDAALLLGEQQVVVKPLPSYLSRFNIKQSGIAGCTILGDGNISIILDISNLYTPA